MACFWRLVGFHASRGLRTGVCRGLLEPHTARHFFDAGMGNPLAIRGGATVPARGLETLLGGLPPELREGDPLDGYATLLEHPDHAVRLSAARRWSVFEATLANLVPDAARIAGASEEQVAYAMARIEVHYFRTIDMSPKINCSGAWTAFATCRQPSCKVVTICYAPL